MISEKNKFQKLTPIKDIDLGIYEDALDYVFKSPDINNVAISGAYSAGKSSVIETYKSKHKEKIFLHISLGNFESTSCADKECKSRTASSFEKSAGKYNDTTNPNNDLEGKILNQLIHQIDVKKIPQSNFSTKRPVSRGGSIRQAFTVLVFLITAVFIWEFDFWTDYVKSQPLLYSKMSWSINPFIPLIGMTILAILLLWFLFSIIQLQKNRNLLRKVNLHGNEIEIFNKDDSLYFDRHLNEVLYLFEHSGAEAIAFEDMDRYDENHIFQQLREINVLINDRIKSKDMNPIRFFYLIRDDIFVSKDRTKFFDFIIPVVPVLDSSNAYDQFIEQFGSTELFKSFDTKFLQGVSLYIDDMRILKNVYNEFVIYNNKINTTGQNINKLLAMIIYKNLFPKDFSDLQLNKGFVYELFRSQSNLVKEEKETLQKEISDANEEIESIKSEILHDEKEIDILYRSNEYTNDEELLTERQQEKEHRLELINQRNNGGIERLQADIQKNKKEINSLNSLKLSELINKENVETAFDVMSENEIGEINDFKEIKKNDYFNLLKYLIREGYIDETYPDYMTYFYANSLSRNDKAFLRSVTDREPKEYTYSLDNPVIIVERLRDIDFEREETLNFDLLTFLLQNKISKNELLTVLVKQLRDTMRYDFIIQFIDCNREVKTFIRKINSIWPEFFESALEKANYDETQIIQIVLLILNNLTQEELINIDSHKALSNYISNCTDFLQIDKPDVETLISQCESINVKFRKIDFDKSNRQLWGEVYTHNLYELNLTMIADILDIQYGIVADDGFYEKNLSLIFSKPEEPLALYVKANIVQYMELVIAQCDGSISDTEETVVYILNEEDITDNQKRQYLDKLSANISCLNDIKNNAWWGILLSKGLIAYSEDNILHYFFGTGKIMDNTLTEFINEYATSYSYKSELINQVYGDDATSVFFNQIVRCNLMENVHYRNIIKSLNRYYGKYDIEGIDADKVTILVELHVIRMSTFTLDFMREHYPEQVIIFIENNQKEYVENTIDNNSFNMLEALDVLGSKVKSTYKINLLKFTEEGISLKGVNYEAKVEAYILKHNFSEDDLPYVLESYDKFDTLSQKAIENIVKEDFDRISCSDYKFAFTLLIKILSCASLVFDRRMELFSHSIINLNQAQCWKCLDVLGAKNYHLLFQRKRPKFDITPINERILNAFKYKGWITKYYVDGNEYRAIGRKLK